MKARNVAVEIVRAGGSVEDAAAETGLEAAFICQLVEKERSAVSQRAASVLAAADVEVIRAAEQALMSDAWLAWRDDVRAVARGESLVIPPEPSDRLRNIPIPDFLKDAPPYDVSDTLEEYGLKSSDSYERVNDALVAAMTKAKGSAELARGYGGAFDGKSVVEWERKAQSINESIRWNSGRRAETL